MAGPVSFWQRPSVALANLVQGNLSGAGLALFKPSSLGPDETHTLSEYLTDLADKNPVVKGVMDVATDPMFVIGTLLSMRYPIAGLRDLYDTGKRAARGMHNPGFIERMVGRGDELFAGTRIPELAARSVEVTHGVWQDLGGRLAGALERFQNGYKGKPGMGRLPTDAEQMAIGVKLEGWDKPGPTPFSTWFAWANEKFEKATGRPMTNPYERPIDFVKDFGSEAGSAMHRLFEELKEFRQYTYDTYTSKMVKTLETPDGRTVKDEELLAGLRTALGLGKHDDLFPGAEEWLVGRGLTAKDILAHYQRWLPDYLPHIPLRSRLGDAMQMENMAADALEEASIYGGREAQKAGTYVPRAARYRLGGVVPKLADMAMVPGFNAQFADDMKTLMQARLTEAKGALGPLAELIDRGGDWKNPISTFRGEGARLSAEDLARIVSEQAGGGPTDTEAAIRAAVKKAVGEGNLKAYTQEVNAIVSGMRTKNWDQAWKAYHNMLDMLADVPQYTLHPVAAYESMTMNLGRPFAWVVGGLPQKVRTVEGGREVVRDFVPEPLGRAIIDAAEPLPTPSKVLLSEYVPALMGKMNASQMKQVQMWQGIRLNALDKINKMPDWLVNPEQKKWWEERLTEGSGPLSYQTAMHKVAGYMYTGTMGANLGSAAKNALQTFLTTSNWIGPQATLRGIQETLTKAPKYFEARMAGKNAQEAMLSVWPEYAASRGAQTTLAEDMIRGSLESSFQMGLEALPPNLRRLSPANTSKFQEVASKIREYSLKAFSATENFNRLVAFEGAIWKGTQEGIPLRAKVTNHLGETVEQLNPELVDLANKVVQTTQFSTGPMQVPNLIKNWPAPLRQFMHFPLRFLGFLQESTRAPWAFKNGADQAAWESGKRNWGTIGRVLQATSGVYHTGMNLLNVDLSGGMLTGALPLPQIPNSPFYPAPFVPPILSVGGLLGMAALEGDPERLVQAASIGVPGGVAFTRAAQTFGPRFAKYDQMTPDGRIPLYNKDGGLIAAYSPFQLALKGIGIQAEDPVKEREMAKYLLSQRDQIREFRQRYVMAVVNNQPEEAERVQNEWKQRYPQFGELQVKKADIAAAQQRMQLSRIERLVQTMPVEYRSQFQDVAAAVNGNMMGNMLGPVSGAIPSAPLQATFGNAGGIYSMPAPNFFPNAPAAPYVFGTTPPVGNGGGMFSSPASSQTWGW